MSLIRQVWLLLLGTLALALCGSLGVWVYSASESARVQLRVHNADAATMLALALSQHRGEPELMRLVAMAQFDTGHYREIRLTAPGGQVLFERQAPAQATQAPDWFVQIMGTQAEQGVAIVTDGWVTVGRLQVRSQSAWVADDLWWGCMKLIALLGVVGLAGVGVGSVAVRNWRKPLEAAVMQAKALEEGRFVQVPEPAIPELQRVSSAMNMLSRRLRHAFETQAEQVHALRLQASIDPVTGLAHRRYFVNQVDAALREPGARGGALLIVRLCRLHQINQRAGHEATDRILGTLAEVLQAYPRAVSGALVGRLNGCDFGLFLPAAGLAMETASSLVLGLKSALKALDEQAEVVIGGADPLLGHSVVGALAAADAALAQAEAQGPFSVEVCSLAQSHPELQGEQAWREALASALEFERVRLTEYPVQTRSGVLLHQECPMQVQLLPDGPYEPASAWLWMGIRARLTARADLLALQLVLHANERQPGPRCIHIAGASLASFGFVPEFARMLARHPGVLLSVEVNECVAAEHTELLREAARAWRPLGVRIGLEHAGASLQELARLNELGVDYVKIDERYIHGVSRNDVTREFARSLATLVHSMQLQVVASGVADAQDLAKLWQIGFDAATGPALAHAGIEPGAG